MISDNPAMEFSEPETQQENILRPSDVTDCTRLRHYFMQRLGPEHDTVWFMQISYETYMGLMEGSYAILGRMINEEPEAADEIFLSMSAERENYLAMTFHIEHPEVGNMAVEFIREHKNHSQHDVFLQQVEQLAFCMQKLHHRWKHQPFEFYKIPSSILNAEQEALAELQKKQERQAKWSTMDYQV